MAEKFKPLNLFSIEIGKDLSDDNSVDMIKQRVSLCRNQILEEYGVEIPPVRIQNSAFLAEWEYAIFVSGVLVKKFALKKDCCLALDLGNVTQKMDGEATKDLGFGMEALWIPFDTMDLAKKTATEPSNGRQ